MILKVKNILDIIVWARDKDISTPWDFKNDLKGVIIEIGEKEIHQLY